MILGKNFKWEIFCLDITIDKNLKIKIAITKPINPPNLLGIDRKTAYKWRKYHSGWIWIGELDKSLGMKFTGSADQSGRLSAHIHIIHKNKIFTLSFIRKEWANFIFNDLLRPLGVLLPLKWRNTKWKKTIPSTKKGIKKCNA